LGRYPIFRLTLIGIAIAIGISLWLLLNRTKLGMMIRAGVDDRDMLAAMGKNVPMVFIAVAGLGGLLAGLGGVVGGSALAIAPGEDARMLLSSLVVVIVGGMGSVVGAAMGALLVGFAEQFGLAYTPTYGVVYTFLIMVVVLAVRPRGLFGAVP
jgi:branched-chain amino acid transport system permease protein